MWANALLTASFHHPGREDHSRYCMPAQGWVHPSACCAVVHRAASHSQLARPLLMLAACFTTASSCSTDLLGLGLGVSKENTRVPSSSLVNMTPADLSVSAMPASPAASPLPRCPAGVTSRPTRLTRTDPVSATGVPVRAPFATALGTGVGARRAGVGETIEAGLAEMPVPPFAAPLLPLLLGAAAPEAAGMPGKAGKLGPGVGEREPARSLAASAASISRSLASILSYSERSRACSLRRSSIRPPSSLPVASRRISATASACAAAVAFCCSARAAAAAVTSAITSVKMSRRRDSGTAR
mmetsp:Transcript_25075/g.63577  ORF Transcript_25075/g.63577 Transcript_25075/m.63577 type:complete len:299 (-) Transcript_25075:3057-3953(-)